MANIVKPTIQLKLDASTSIQNINAQIVNEIQPNLKPVNISLNLNSDSIKNQTSQIQAQLNSVAKINSAGFKVPIDFNVDANKVKEQLASIVGKIRNGEQGTVINYKVNLDKDNNFESVMLKYRNDANQVTDSLLKLGQAGNWQETIKSVSQNIEQTTKKTEQLIEAQQKQANSIAELSEKYGLLQTQTKNAGIGSLSNTNTTGFQNALNSNDVQQATHYLSLLRTEYQQLNAEMSKKLPQNAIDNMQERAQSLSTQIDQITAKFSTLNTTGESNFTKNFSTQIEQANTSIKELQTNLNTFNTAKTGQEQVTAFNQLNNSVKDSKTQVNDLGKAYQTLNRVEASTGSFEKYLQQNPQVLEKHAQQVNEIRNQWKQVSQETDITKLQAGFKEINTATSAFKGEIRSLGQEGRTVLGELGNDLKKQLQWLTSGTLLFGTIAGIKDMYSEIVKLDDQMVELRKVTDESEATYSKFYNTANETAKSLGVTTESVIGATAAWAQMGYNLPDSTELAKDSEIFKNISENMTVDEATNSLISTLKAFKISSGDVLDGVISKVNEVGNRFAVTNKDIAEGLERSASSMAVANNSMDQTIALLTAATEVTRDADSAGTALKTEFCLCVQKCA